MLQAATSKSKPQVQSRWIKTSLTRLEGLAQTVCCSLVPRHATEGTEQTLSRTKDMGLTQRGEWTYETGLIANWRVGRTERRQLSFSYHSYLRRKQEQSKWRLLKWSKLDLFLVCDRRRTRETQEQTKETRGISRTWLLGVAESTLFVDRFNSWVEGWVFVKHLEFTEVDYSNSGTWIQTKMLQFLFSQ